MGRADAVREALDAADGERGFDAPLALCAPDFRQHFIPLGIEVEGPDDFRTNVVPLAESIRFRQKVVNVVEHGDFVVAVCEVQSTLRSAPGTMTYTIRFDGDRATEIWSISDPVDLPS